MISVNIFDDVLFIMTALYKIAMLDINWKELNVTTCRYWIPAFAGMTDRSVFDFLRVQQAYYTL